MEKLNALLELAALFTREEFLQKELQLAYNQPLNYANQFTQELLERGIDHHTPNLPWFALINGLERKQLLQELDWKDEAEELIGLVIEFTKGHTKQEQIKFSLDSTEPLLNDDIEEFLPSLNTNLRQYNIQLVWLDIDSDSYPLTILALEDIEKAKELASKTGYGVIK